MKKIETFEDMGLSPETQNALAKKGFLEPTPIQREIIPIILEADNDIVGKAKTGTGKTAAFGIPLVELCDEKSKTVQALVLAPTRELALQVSAEIDSLTGSRKLRPAAIYGGQAIRPQVETLKKKPAIIVGTPGRILDHIRHKRLDLSAIRFLVLDEADEMLDMGFQEDLTSILSVCNNDRRTLLFSATMPAAVKKIAAGYMKKMQIVSIEPSKVEKSQTKLIAHEIHARDKNAALCRIIEAHNDFYGIVFCRTKMDTDATSQMLKSHGFPAEALHGDLSQAQREKILRWLKTRKNGILVATDVAARGIDISELKYVVNFSVPDTPEAFMHRIGRTGRAGKSGMAITLVSASEFSRLKRIEKTNGLTHERKKLPDGNEILLGRKKHLKESLLQTLSYDIPSEYIDLARELLELSSPDFVLGALLKNNYGNKFLESAGKDIPVLDKKNPERKKRRARTNENRSFVEKRKKRSTRKKAKTTSAKPKSNKKKKNRSEK